MKGKKITSAAVSILLLILFLPVFYHIIVTGNHTNYNAEHKIETLYPNTTLFLYVILAVFLFGGLYYLLSKIPVRKSTIIGTIFISFFSCILFYIIKVEISKNIAFYGGWDCGMVANSARWVFNGDEIGYDDYYFIYSNNIPITWLLYILYQFSNSIVSYPYNPEFIWIQFQCFMFSLAVFFSVMTVLLISKKIAPTILSLILSLLFLGLCPWQIIPYTDASTIVMPILVVFLYTLFRHIPSKSGYIIWLLCVFVGIIGGIMKATCYISIIAVVLVDCVWLFWDKEKLFQKGKKLAVRLILFICGFLLALWCKKGMYETIHYIPDYDLEMTWSNYFYNGLNEETTGACSGEGLAIVQEYAGYPRSFRQAVELQYIKNRIAEKGWKGLIDFWFRKQIMNFNDGTFSWFQEGYFHAWDYQEISDNFLERWKQPLRDFYWKDGVTYQKFTTWSQGIWIFILLGISLEAVCVVLYTINFKNRRFQIKKLINKKLINRELVNKELTDKQLNNKESNIQQLKEGKELKEDTEVLCIYTVEIVNFLGIFFFVMLFEGRARYLLNHTAVFLTMAVLGYSGLMQIIYNGIKKLKSRK